jgi:hypothetical protein
VSNFENVKISLSLSFIAIFLQQFIALQNLPSITDNNDILLLKGYFAVSWCLLITLGLLYIRRGYIRYHDSIEDQLNEVYENQLLKSKSALAINIQDYRNLQLHGTVLNTLIYARDNLNLGKLKDRKKLSNLLTSDIAVLKGGSDFENYLEFAIRKTASEIGNREMDVWIEPIKINGVPDEARNQIVEIVREKILNLKKHSLAQNCEISVQVTSLKSSGFAFVRPTQYRVVIEIKDDAIAYEGTDNSKHETGVLGSKSLNRILEPILATQGVRVENNTTIHHIEIPLINFQPDASQKLFDLRNKSQEFVAKSYVLISMLYGAISLPALLRVNIPTDVFLVLAIVVIGSIISVFTPRFNIPITLANGLLALLPLYLATNNQQSCQNLDYLPWIFNGLIGPIFFAVLTIPYQIFRWLPAIIFFIESIVVTELLPQECQSLLAGSTPAIIVLSFLAIIVLRIRKRSYSSDQNIITQFQNEANIFTDVKFKIDHERNDLIDSLAQFATIIPLSPESEATLKKQLDFYILEIRALLVSTEYFDHRLVQAIYYVVKNRLHQEIYSELHIVTDKFAEFESDKSYVELERALSTHLKNKDLRISIVSTDKTEVRYAILNNRSPEAKVLFEDANIRLVKT